MGFLRARADFMLPLQRRCQGQHSHVPLVGRELSTQSATYHSGLVAVWAQAEGKSGRWHDLRGSVHAGYGVLSTDKRH